MGIYFNIILSVSIVLSSYFVFNFFRDGEVPILEEEFWGPASQKSAKEDKSIRPFEIKVAENVIADLKSRLKVELASDRFTESLEGIGFEYGFGTDLIRKISTHWLNKYDWRQREKILNKYPNFKTKIAGLDIHFQHVKKSQDETKEKKIRPLLLLHGWPGSFVDFQKIIPLLTQEEKNGYEFELVIPSLVGYGFSDKAARPGMGTVEMGTIFVELMKRLGHSQFYVHGEDWGSMIGTDMSILYPNNVLGFHSSTCLSIDPRSHLKLWLTALFPSKFMSKEEARLHLPLLDNTYGLLMRETGYLHIHATKPDTVGIALSNSPSGLAAYILEKLSTWTNRDWHHRKDGGILPYYNIDELLDNVMMYWVTNSMTSAVRLYSEFFKPVHKYETMFTPSHVPTSCMTMPEDLLFQPRYVLRDKFRNIVRYTRSPKGGHFAAFEQPEILAEDIIGYFNTL